MGADLVSKIVVAAVGAFLLDKALNDRSGRGAHPNRNWEKKLTTWAKPPSDSEAERCERAERVIRKAIEGADELGEYDIEVFAQGSYKRGSNIRKNSDVDICVHCTSHYLIDHDDDLPENVGAIQVASPSDFETFRARVGEVLSRRFDSFWTLWSNVSRGKKSFKVDANTARVQADVVCTFRHYRFSRSGGRSVSSEETASFLSDDDELVVNWPRANQRRATSKNTRTKGRFQDLVRIYKNLRDEMLENGVSGAGLPSFFLESALSNVPDEAFDGKYEQALQATLTNLLEAVEDEELAESLTELNGIEPLFADHQNWSLEQAETFLEAAWDYVGYPQPDDA